MNSIIPEIKAQSILKEYGVKSPKELNMEEIANAEGLIVEEDDLKNYLGRISFTGDYGLIKIDSKIKEPGQKRFTLAHETGHYFNEKDTLTQSLIKFGTGSLPKGEEKSRDKTYNCTAEDLFSFKVNKKREDDANIFAAELLMHRPWFNNFTKNREINFELIKEISEYFNVSLTAAALRYLFTGKYPVAVIMSKNGEVAWSAASDYFPLKYLPKGYKVRKESAAYDFFNGKETQKEADLVLSTTWFGEDYKGRKELYFYEQNVVMRNYNSVLTLLWESEFR